MLAPAMAARDLPGPIATTMTARRRPAAVAVVVARVVAVVVAFVVALVVVAAPGARADDGLPDDVARAIVREAQALGAVATTGAPGDPAGSIRRNAEARFAALAIAAIAEHPAQHGAIMAAVAEAAPALAGQVRDAASAAYPVFAADFVAPGFAAPDAKAADTETFDEEAFDEEDWAFVDAQAAAQEPMSDPFEGANRFVFALNDAADTLALRPLAATYGFVVPVVLKRAIRRFYGNLKSPVILANDLFQGDVTDGAAVTLARFAINSTAGLAGFLDIAEDFGLDRHDADFGQTLHAYGVGPGPYVVLPLFGPSTARDALGTGVDSFLDPLGYVLPAAARLGLLAGKAITKREEVMDQLDQLRLGALDAYAAVRAAFYLHRAQELGLIATTPEAAGP
ncbi:MAG: MlaA family lipoprotein [Alphaproteobacteria bacterium]